MGEQTAGQTDAQKVARLAAVMVVPKAVWLENWMVVRLVCHSAASWAVRMECS